MKRWGLLLLVVLCLPSSAGAVTLETPDGQIAQPYQRWANGSAVPTAPGVVVYRQEDCPGAPRPACIAEQGNTFFGGRGDYLRFDRLGVLHELGHVFDYRVLTDPERQRFTRLVGHQGAGWDDQLVRNASPGFWASPREWFAVGYSLCAERQAPDGYDEGYGYTPTRHEQRQVCALIRRAGGWFMLSAALVTGSR